MTCFILRLEDLLLTKGRSLPAASKVMNTSSRDITYQTGKASLASCLVAWLQVCNPKEHGGLGIKDMGTQNICLLLKLIRKLHCPQSSAWAQWVQGRACISSLKGDIYGDHWEVLRSLLPLYIRRLPLCSLVTGSPAPSGWTFGAGTKH